MHVPCSTPSFSCSRDASAPQASPSTSNGSAPAAAISWYGLLSPSDLWVEDDGGVCDGVAFCDSPGDGDNSVRRRVPESASWSGVDRARMDAIFSDDSHWTLV